MFRKGSVLVRVSPNHSERPSEIEKEQQISAEAEEVEGEGKGEAKGRRRRRVKQYEGLTGEVTVLHEDIIRDGFWDERPWLLL